MTRHLSEPLLNLFWFVALIIFAVGDAVNGKAVGALLFGIVIGVTAVPLAYPEVRLPMKPVRGLVFGLSCLACLASAFLSSV